MDNKINIAELLKDCPKGMELDCTMYDNVTLDRVDIDDTYSIKIDTKCGFSTRLTRYGQNVNIEDAKCVIFPKGKTTWEGFVPPHKFKDGDILSYQCGLLSNRTIYIYRYDEVMNTSYYVALSGDIDSTFRINDRKEWTLRGYDKTVRLATEEEKQKLFEAIKSNGYKWNAETKTLEEIVEPKFKVWDKIRHKNDETVITITGIKDDYYFIQFYNVRRNDYQNEKVSFKDQDQYELVPNKFDIATLKPFSEVLVRYDNDNPWMTAHFSHYMKDVEWECPYFASGACFKQCIPYKGNEHLRGTTNDCDDFYKTWK